MAPAGGGGWDSAARPLSLAFGDPPLPGNPGTLSLVPLVATELPRIHHRGTTGGFGWDGALKGDLVAAPQSGGTAPLSHSPLVTPVLLQPRMRLALPVLAVSSGAAFPPSRVLLCRAALSSSPSLCWCLGLSLHRCSPLPLALLVSIVFSWSHFSSFGPPGCHLHHSFVSPL